MKKFFKILPFTLFVGCFFIINTVSAQTKSFNNPSVVFVNGYVFEDSVKGIKKILKTIKTLENEFKPQVQEIEKLRADYSLLESKIKNASSADQQLVEKADRIRRDASFKSEDLKTRYNKRYTQVMDPIYREISVVMNTWCKQKGYSALLDYSKINNGMLLWVDEEFVDTATTELINYINSKVF